MTYSYAEKQIMHEASGGKFWVLRTGSGYCVMENKHTHSEGDGIEYPRTPDGLSRAELSIVMSFDEWWRFQADNARED